MSFIVSMGSDLTVCARLGSFEQPLIREVFAGQLVENLQCKVWS